MAGPDTLEGRVRSRLQEIDRAHLRRTLRSPQGIDLSSNDYLGLSRHPAVVNALVDGVRAEGCGSTGSRLLRGEREAFAAVERRFAAFKGTDRALYFSSGYLANLAVVTAFAERGDCILSDALNHASLIDAVRLSAADRVVVPHADEGALERALAEAGEGRTLFVLTESLFSMDGDEAPLARYGALCRRFGAALIVDEAHAVGVYGRRGSGLIEDTVTAGDVFLSINTAGKALGVAGAFVAGPAWAIEYLVQRARPFIFSTAAPPALAWAIDASLDLVEREPDRRANLLALAGRLRARLADAGVPCPPGRSQIVPVVVGGNERALALAERLQAEGFDVRAIRPPTVPEGSARLRISLNTDLTDAEVDRFAARLVDAMAVQPCPVASS
ncbi:MAG: 8-amino-7-oxononanoate synthase [Acidimicrobiia bacterium]|nr:8-amino-7-oxononanoate synthase [Acidimicrobiia bacterium]